MGACVVLTPVIAAAWPLVSASVLGAAGALGFAVAGGQEQKKAVKETCVSLEVKGSSAVTDGLRRDERLTFVKDGITVAFERDARGKCGVTVSGTGHEKAELEAVGREFSQQVIQQYAYHRLMEELSRQNFAVVDQQVGEDRTIHVSVRRFE